MLVLLTVDTAPAMAAKVTQADIDALKGSASDLDKKQKEIQSKLNDLKDDKAAALQTALASCGNCKIVYGTYTGNGKSGSANPNKLTFDGNPLFVIIKGSIGSAPTLGIQAMRGWYTAYTGSADSSTVCHLTWGEHSLSWYNSQSSSDQFNTSDSVYPYIALFATQE